MLFLIQGQEVAASRYRVLQYLPYLKARGVETDVIPYPATLGELYTFFSNLPDYDCLFLQRKRFHGLFLKLLRRRARKIVYDFDDAVMYKNSKSSSPFSATRQRRFAAMIKSSDYVIAGNSFLKEEAAKLMRGKLIVIPTVIDERRYPVKEYDLKKERITIGWIGDHGSIHYLEKMRPVFEELGKKYPHVELEIICDVFFDCDNIPVVKRMWSAEREIEYLHELDIGVMPLVQDPWSAGKCGLKILQYFGVGVPTVCTPVGVNKDVIRDGFNGFFAESLDQWIEKLSLLIEDQEKRKIMGMRGREIVFQSFSLSACAPKFYDVLHETVSKERCVGNDR
jgi:glycosyltransferase involved in cell wall biosynthesis